eukprot:GAHX01001776.1.p1 GENE.GAHX01001776.1~~GAHX01001776.1.p1  ORF type:complete len:468 (-),score=100.17 GAHX01001776.1:67-1470(-)
MEGKFSISEINQMFSLTGLSLSKPALTLLMKQIDSLSHTAMDSFVEKLLESFSSIENVSITFEDMERHIEMLSKTHSKVERVLIRPRTMIKQDYIKIYYSLLHSLLKRSLIKTTHVNQLYTKTQAQESELNFIFGYLSFKSNIYTLEDFSGSITLKILSSTSFENAFVLPNSIVLCCGRIEHDEQNTVTFLVKSFSNLPLEPRSESLKHFEDLKLAREAKIYFNKLKIQKEESYLDNLVSKSAKHQNEPNALNKDVNDESEEIFMFFGDVSLQNECIISLRKTIEKVYLALQHNETHTLSSVYISLQNNKNHVYNEEEIKAKFVKESWEGLNVYILSTENLHRFLIDKQSKIFKEEICFYNKQCFDLIVNKSILKPDLQKVEIEKHFIKLLIEQKNFNFFEEEKSAEELQRYIYPLPNLLLLQEKSLEAFKYEYGEVLVCNVGSFSENKEFIMYYNNKKEIEISKLD